MHLPRFCMFVAICLTCLTCLGGCLSEQFQASPLVSKQSMKKLEGQYGDLVAVVAKVNAITDPIQQTQARDQMATDLLLISDYKYSLFRDRVFVNNADLGSALDLTSIGMSAAAVMSSGPAAQALEAADTALKASRGVVGAEFIGQQTLTSLLSSIDAKRASLRQGIEANLQLPSTQYSASQALNDIAVYHQSASLVAAVLDLQQSTANQKTANQQSLSAFREQVRVSKMHHP